MAINFYDGDIKEAKERYIVHQVNCQGIMGSGLAKQIKEKWPEVNEAYVRKCLKQKNELLGTVLPVQTNDGKIICNVFGQYNYGSGKRQTSYLALFNGLCEVLKNAKSDVAIPANVGCCRGGANWIKVFNFIQTISEDFRYDINIYHYDESLIEESGTEGQEEDVEKQETEE